MLTYNYTIRTLMTEVNMSYDRTYRLMERMRTKGLVKDLGVVKVGAKNAKLYGLTMLPNEFLEAEEARRGKSPKPPAGFFNNPFNLHGAIDARYVA